MDTSKVTLKNKTKEELLQEIDRFSSMATRLTIDNDELKNSLKKSEIRCETAKLLSETLTEELKEYNFDFSNPKEVCRKILFLATGSKLEDVVLLSNYIQSSVYDNLLKISNNQKEDLTETERALRLLTK